MRERHDGRSATPPASDTKAPPTRPPQTRSHNPGGAEAAEVVRRLSTEAATSEAEPAATRRPPRQGVVPSPLVARFERSTGADLSDLTFTRSAGNPHFASARGAHIDIDQSVDVNSRTGAAIVGHEVAHVLQARAGTVPRSGGSVRVPRLEAQASRLGDAMAAAGDVRAEVPRDATLPVDISGGAEQGLVPLIAAVVLNILKDYVVDQALDFVRDDLEAMLEEKRQQAKAIAWSTIRDSSPTAVFLIEWAPTLTKIWQTLQQVGSVADEVLEQVILTIIANEATGANGLSFNEADARKAITVMRVGFKVGKAIATDYWNDFYNSNMTKLGVTAESALAAMRETQKFVQKAADNADTAGMAVDALHAASSPTNLAKDAAKLAQGKDLKGAKAAKMVKGISEGVNKDVAEVEEFAAKAQALRPDSSEKITSDFMDEQKSAFAGAASAAVMPSVMRARNAFYAARTERRKEGSTKTAGDVLSATHGAGGANFVTELLTAGVAAGGKVLVFKGALYMVPMGAATARLIADASGPLFKLACDLNREMIVDGMLWAFRHPKNLITAGLEGAREWVDTLVNNPVTWAMMNPLDALALGPQKLAQLGKNVGATVASVTDATARGALNMGAAIGSGALGLATGLATAVVRPDQAAEQLWQMSTATAQGVVDGAKSMLSSGASLVSGTYDTVAGVFGGAGAFASLLWTSTTSMLSKAVPLQLLGRAKDYALQVGLLTIPGVGSALAAMEAIATFAIQHPEVIEFLRDYSEESLEHWGFKEYAPRILGFYDYTVGAVAKSGAVAGQLLDSMVAKGKTVPGAEHRARAQGSKIQSGSTGGVPPAAAATESKIQSGPANKWGSTEDAETREARKLAAGFPTQPAATQPSGPFFVPAQRTVEQIGKLPSAFIGKLLIDPKRLATSVDEGDRAIAHRQKARGDVESLVEVSDLATMSVVNAKAALSALGYTAPPSLDQTPPLLALEAATSRSMPIAPIVAIAMWYVMASVASEQSRRLDS